MEFHEFLQQTKARTYASGMKPETLPNGSKRLVVSEGRFTYTDTWRTFDRDRQFRGCEKVSSPGREWSMGYYGHMENDFKPSNGIGMNELYDFLRESLRLVPKETPFRGPKTHSRGKLRYENKWVGELDHFEGVEKIFVDGKAAYSLHYSGGFEDYVPTGEKTETSLNMPLSRT